MYQQYTQQSDLRYHKTTLVKLFHHNMYRIHLLPITIFQHSYFTLLTK